MKSHERKYEEELACAGLRRIHSRRRRVRDDGHSAAGAAATGVDIPTAGHYISAYAIGVCFGTLILVFGRKVPPKDLIIAFMVIALMGNLFSAFSANAAMLVIARFISGLPHGAFFGTATLIAKTLADKGKEAQAVSIMVTGQTLANMLGVPAGTLMAEFLSWRLASAFWPHGPQ